MREIVQRHSFHSGKIPAYDALINELKNKINNKNDISITHGFLRPEMNHTIAGQQTKRNIMRPTQPPPPPPDKQEFSKVTSVSPDSDSLALRLKAVLANRNMAMSSTPASFNRSAELERMAAEITHAVDDFNLKYKAGDVAPELIENRKNSVSAPVSVSGTQSLSNNLASRLKAALEARSENVNSSASASASASAISSIPPQEMLRMASEVKHMVDNFNQSRNTSLGQSGQSVSTYNNSAWPTRVLQAITKFFKNSMQI
ncbi:hypothetical protein CIT292_11274 [Citrobacter youngae ATCC 29220]|uniref:Uncharacterized protein n=2 Tax=Citrobacter youngae TaxID=133448 RepID=D4BL34_9ENTR|nr:hypothetical protein CIT292_11274 [Citrobacter youngae ATCC 29220]